MQSWALFLLNCFFTVVCVVYRIHERQKRKGGGGARGVVSNPYPISFQQFNKQGHKDKIKEKKTNEKKTESDKELKHLYTVNKYSDFFSQFQLL